MFYRWLMHKIHQLDANPDIQDPTLWFPSTDFYNCLL